jgi:Ca-activated chloride channel family protein
MSSTASSFAPVAAPTGVPIRLAMQRLWLTGQVLSAGARLIVQHVFQSDEEQPLEVIYSFPLPRDAALRRFAIRGDGFEVHSELRETAEAVKAYEEGIANGSLAALVRQYGDGIVNLTVGNIRPKEKVTVSLELLAGVELRDDGFRFRFPFTLAPAYHARMRASATGGEAELELPANEFGDLMLPPIRKDASSLHEVGFELSVPHQLSVDEIGSPSHSIRVRQGEAAVRVALAPEKDVPDRDLVLDVRFQGNRSQILAGSDSAGKRSFAVVVPSTVFGVRTEHPHRIAILLDRSGSMQGAPITQARKAIEACLAALSEQDSFLLLAFDDRVEAMQPALAPATHEQRERARAFLQQVEARGGTELAAGVREAARALGADGDVVILTDGQVFGSEKILAEARACGIRLFCLGIGSASQDRFLSLLARETGGISRFVTPRERVDLAAIDLFASTGRPVASGLIAAGAQPDPPRLVFAGTPVLLFGEVESLGDPRVNLTWDGGNMSFDLPAGDAETGETVRLLRGSRLITDMESRYPAEDALAPLEKRRQNRVAARLLELSRTFGLASREMSLVAVVKRVGDRPGELPETRVVPVGMAQDVELSAYFHGPITASPQLAAAPPLLAASVNITGAAPPAQAETGRFRYRTRYKLSSMPSQPDAAASDDSELVDLAAMVEPDGGMPGDDSDWRAARTIAALLAFVAEGHTLTAGAFRLHVARLAGFLTSLHAVSASQAQLVKEALVAASTGKAPVGPWLALARKPDTGWKQVEAALA